MRREPEKIPTHPADGPAEKVWDDYFRAHRPDAAAVCDVVLRLQKEGRPDELIACLEAALKQGQSQPWMYTVLALAMEKTHRPKAEVERVLLSGVDYSAVNVSNMLYSAAFLARFGADDRALELYRQAGQVDPTRLEPYVLGLRLASERRDPEAVGWAASGILTRAWSGDYERLHRDAEAAVRALEVELRGASRTAEADRLVQSLEKARQRDLVIDLSWSGKADIDLLVEEPSGTICSSENPSTTGGGVFVHDGVGVDPQDNFDKYVCPQGMAGDYRAIIRHVRGEVVGKRAVLRIVRYQGMPGEIEERITIPLAESDTLVRISLQNGRLQALTAIPLLEAPRGNDTIGGNRRREVARRQRNPHRAGPEIVADRRRMPGNAATVGYQPVITLLSEGVSMAAMGVVSGDRRYVRLSLSPIFSTITDVHTFSFVTSGGANPNGGGGTGGAGAGGAGASGFVTGAGTQ